MRTRFLSAFSYAYPYALLDLPVKVSVSNLSMHMEDEKSERYMKSRRLFRIFGLHEGKKAEAPETSSGAARRARLSLKVMRLLDFTAASGAAEEIRDLSKTAVFLRRRPIW